MSFDIYGHLLTVSDTPTYPYATVQRIQVLLLTSPRLIDVDGTAQGRPDDYFNPDFGAGLAVAVGELPTQALADGITARIMSALAADPAIAQSPAPSVGIVSSGPFYTVTVTFTTIAQQRVVLTHSSETGTMTVGG